MPQLNKGGKFVFGLSKIHHDCTIQFPKQAIEEYNITKENAIILITGSKKTGGFCVTNKLLLGESKLKHILNECPELALYKLLPCEFINYKGRGYCWINISSTGKIKLTQEAMSYLNLSIGDQLLAIRSSDIAFAMGAKGPLLEKSKTYDGVIDVF